MDMLTRRKARQTENYIALNKTNPPGYVVRSYTKHALRNNERSWSEGGVAFDLRETPFGSGTVVSLLVSVPGRKKQQYDYFVWK